MWDLPGSRMNPCLLHWQVDSLSLSHLGTLESNLDWKKKKKPYCWLASLEVGTLKPKYRNEDPAQQQQKGNELKKKKKSNGSITYIQQPPSFLLTSLTRHTYENPHPLSGDCQRSPPVPRRWHGVFPMFSASQRNSPSRAGPYHHYHVQWQERPGILRSVTFFLLFFSIFHSFFFLSTSLCFANRIKTLTKISFSEEKHFYRTKTATCFAANTQLKAGKENIYKIQVFFFSIFDFVFFLQC